MGMPAKVGFSLPARREVTNLTSFRAVGSSRMLCPRLSAIDRSLTTHSHAGRQPSCFTTFTFGHDDAHVVYISFCIDSNFH